MEENAERFSVLCTLKRSQSTAVANYRFSKKTLLARVCSCSSLQGYPPWISLSGEMLLTSREAVGFCKTFLTNAVLCNSCNFPGIHNCAALLVRLDGHMAQLIVESFEHHILHKPLTQLYSAKNLLFAFIYVEILMSSILQKPTTFAFYIGTLTRHTNFYIQPRAMTMGNF